MNHKIDKTFMDAGILAEVRFMIRNKIHFHNGIMTGILSPYEFYSLVIIEMERAWRMIPLEPAGSVVEIFESRFAKIAALCAHLLWSEYNIAPDTSFKLFFDELNTLAEEYPAMGTVEEGIALIQAGVDSLWEEIKKTKPNFANDRAITNAAVNVAALCARFMVDQLEYIKRNFKNVS